MKKTTNSTKSSVLALEKHILKKALALLSHDSQVVPRRKVIQDTMVLKNYGLVVHVALRHRRDDIPFEDLLGYGTEGLIKAVEGFDAKKGSRFSSYAGRCISQTITRCVIGNETFIRLPENRAMEKKRKSREEIKVQVKGVNASQSLQKAERREPEVVLSLDECREGCGGDNLLSRIVCENILSPENFVLQRAKKEDTARAVAILKEALLETEWSILRGRFSFDTEKPIPFRKMASILGCAPESVRNKMGKSLEKARGILARNGFESESFF